MLSEGSDAVPDANIPNRLINGKSPYLLQHAYNPVQWYPWGEEALTKARSENKPLFISIGYSVCHWCHVMNRESFDDNDVADVLNKHFIPIKVDREERPDIDKVYMTFAEAMMGSAGWPLNVIATPEGKPFYIGTYFPKTTKNRMIGIIDLLNTLSTIWQKNNKKVIDESNHIFTEVQKYSDDSKAGNVDATIFDTVKDVLENLYDKKHGGFGTSPKFPMPQYLLYLLNYHEMKFDESALNIVETTLVNMYKGGIFDHIGYGFFRYSVDEKWLVPHFEKMLYDNALMSLVYIKAYEITKKDFYMEVANKIYEFIIRDLLADNGGFYSSLDADTEGVEGKYYLFDYDEALDLLGEEWGGLFNRYYDITEKGNFEGKNIPNLLNVSLENMDANDSAILDSILQMLITYRGKRVNPHRDEKILTSWNGLIIGSLAYAGRLLGNKFYIKKAVEAADFVISKSIDENGNLLSTHIDGSSYNYGYLEDYAFFIYGLINIYKANLDDKYLDIAKKLTDDMLDIFGDGENKGLYFYGKYSEKLVLRPKEYYDGAIPSGNGFALIDLMSLFVLTGEERYANIHNEMIHSFGESINTNPLTYLYSVMSLNNFIG